MTPFRYFACLSRAAMLSPLVLAAALAACGGSDDDGAPATPPLALTIAHINDHHSNLDALKDQVMKIGGVDTQVELGGFARVTSAFKAYAGRTDVLKLHAGDANTGTLYYTLFKGKADADLMNTVCFDAMAVGNHEFDDGDGQLKSFIDALYAGACKTPVVAANVRPQVGTPLAPKAADDYLKPYTVKTIQGVPVGIVGITVKAKTQNSSSPLRTTAFDDEAVAAQRTIDQLKGQGVKHIVLLTHQGYDADKKLAAQLTDVDVIIGGDSHTLLGDFSALGSGYASSGAYPTQATNKDGKPVCIGQAWEYSKAIGEMRVSFNDQGEVTACAGQAALLIGDSFKRKDAAGAWVTVDAATQQQITAAVAANKGLKMLAADAGAASVLKGYSGQVDELKKQPIGNAAQALCLVRTPGESTNRSAGVAGCEDANKLARGSDAAQVVVQSFLEASLRADLAIQNAGGVRVPVKAGTITMGDAFTVLPFSNVLVELPVTGAQVAAVLEDAVSAYLDAGQPNGGGHPYAAGLRWNLDLSKPKGQRFSKIEVKDRKTGNWSAIDPARTYIVATNDFIAKGQDGYASFKPIYDSGNYVNNYLLYTQTFVNYIRAKGTVDRPAAGDYSHQAVITKEGVKLP
ncbi:bifunctional metallophosphatase/5'-nucleotidase [Ottowia testudinis]|uniref:5'-nucleotidase C-terminal domain-containing protein n=1 Tax=Ottowia testudinis TaxID=2816950 RepID=A0A975CKF9_9BURK|nr:5'-nucleotidase C-terminal domain-containing protein [Ottowia testudinis]QTD46721.1 5'-nucleotidase C-terminal domain-containing protein [Ottowia testudinis]